MTDLPPSTQLARAAGIEANRPEHGTVSAGERALRALPLAETFTGPIDQPSQRPNEPVQAGLSVGPGPVAPPLPRRNDVTMARMDGLLRASRDPQLAILIGRLKASRLQRP